MAAGIGFRKIHDLDELADAALPIHPDMADHLDRCRPYSAWATEYRYPPEDEAPPPSVNEIAEAAEHLRAFLVAVQDRLGRASG